jgi:hypothetical protein
VNGRFFSTHDSSTCSTACSTAPRARLVTVQMTHPVGAGSEGKRQRRDRPRGTTTAASVRLKADTTG